MLIDQIKYKNKKKKIIGRGGKRGTYSGKGIKGQRARAGRKIRPALRDLVLKLPKKRGFKFKRKAKPIIVNLGVLDKKFQEGEKVSPNSLASKKIVRLASSKQAPKIKILAKGELTKKLTFVSEFLFSRKAKEKISSSGSKIENSVGVKSVKS